jgi:hypothetical protein
MRPPSPQLSDPDHGFRSASESRIKWVNLTLWRLGSGTMSIYSAQVEVARTVISQAEESLRINQNRYDGGLITITDLLGAEEAARRSQADYWQAVYQYHISYANLELASGTLNLQSPVVTP